VSRFVSAELQEKLASIVPPAGAGVRNPVDVGGTFPPPPMLRAVLETVLNEGVVDTIIVDELELARITDLFQDKTQTPGYSSGEIAEVPVDMKKRFGKPVIMVLPVEAIGADALQFEGARRNTRDYFLSEGLPVYLTLERAAKALANLIGYYEFRDAVSSSDSS